MPEKTIKITVTGLIQGVGFRPFIYRIATRYGLKGWVRNTNENVCICISGDEVKTDLFLNSLKTEIPPAACIENILTEETGHEEFTGFSILKSDDVSDEITEISPDIAVCSECLGDIEQDGRRLDYSFVNCTNCGPRFTIIRDLPYDRAKTTMDGFEMCAGCRKEYESVTDRRFHAQPTACKDCGPGYLMYESNEPVCDDINEILRKVARCLDNGGVVAMKGLGGMHLACDAFNEKAVDSLRELKKREAKPFAMMFGKLEDAMKYAEISKVEETSLHSWRRPVVLLKTKSTISAKLPSNLNSGLDLLGIMLPYLPFHHQLFGILKTPAIVLTSGNFSDEPILIDNSKTLAQLSPFTDAVVLHNRDIYNRTDDSVARIIGGKERVFRRSRGYVPSPVTTLADTEGIIAFGAELSNTFCVGKGRKAFLSQHIGDLKGLETTLFYEQTIERFIRLFRVKPSLLAVDMHPDYISTKTAAGFGKLPLIRIQHHHAHIASCMAEHKLDEKVIGVAFDGTGFGDDGNIWGSEFLVCDLAGYSRITHFEYLPLPGGDRASEEPWRTAVSWLYKVFGMEFIHMDLPTLYQAGTENVEMLTRMIDRKVNCPLTSGAGRYLDAVSSILGLCQVAAFPAQGPMLLESAVRAGCKEKYNWTPGQPISLDETLRGIIHDIEKGTGHSIIASKFHNTITSIIFETVNGIRFRGGLNKVVLSGGVFQNKYLLEGTETLLRTNDFEVYSQSSVPANDGGIALGQLAVAAKKRELKCV